MIKVLNISALSYSGTTWLNLILGSHKKALAIGPPHRLWEARSNKFEDVCRIHKNCPFWRGFGKSWDQKENFFVALSRYSGKEVFLMDNAPENFLKETVAHSQIELVNGYYVRDARAITASYARKNADQGVTYEQSIQPNGWFHFSFMNTLGGVM